MTVSALNPMRFFPYTPRPHQERAVELAASVFANGGVGLLSADCGVGKTIAVLSGYLAARWDNEQSRLFIVTRTHSQTRVFESELGVLRETSPDLTATTLVSRARMCPLRGQIDSMSNTGFMHACSQMIRTGQCTYFWNMYKRSNGRPTIRESAEEILSSILNRGVVTRETAERATNEDGMCPYEVLKWSARRSRVIIGPYSYLFKNRVRAATLGFLDVNLHDLDIIVDEAHNLPSHVLDSETARLSGPDLIWLRQNRESIVATVGLSWMADAIDFLWESMMLALDRMGRSSERALDKWEIAPRFVTAAQLEQALAVSRPDPSDPDAVSAAETPVDRLVDFLFAALRATDSDDWHITLRTRPAFRDESDVMRSEITIRPFNAAALASPVLRGARSALLMSGTLRPTEHYARLLGVVGAATIELASPYPRGTRLILIDRVFSTKYDERTPTLWRMIAERVSTALRAVPANKSALVAFPSYAVMREVLSYGIDCGFRERLVESPNSRLETLVEAIQTGPQAIFCVYGGKFSEGVDLVEAGSSLIDLIVGVGVPFVPPTDYQVAFQAWLDRKFGRSSGYYFASTIPSLRKVTQLIGRLRRSPSDWGVVVLIDRRFLKHLHVLGDDIASDMWPFSTAEEMRDAIQQFLEMKGAGVL